MSDPKDECGHCPVPVNECDVQDKSGLERFRRKRAEWLNWLRGDDEHSILKQITEMNWNYIIFRIMNESRGLALNDQQPSSSLNPLLAHFIDNAYFRTQGITIRRLMEKSNDRDPSRQIISIRRLIDDLHKNQCLFTREIYVGFDGTPFDPDPIRAKWEEDRQEKIARHYKAINEGNNPSEAFYNPYPPSSGAQAWIGSKDRHKVFDELTGRQDGQMSRNDCILSTVFDALSKIVNSPELETMKHRCDKLVAHAADSYSRKEYKYETGITFEEVDGAHKLIIEVASFISCDLLVWHPITPGSTGPALFKQLDSPWVSLDNVEKLVNLSRELLSDRKRWAREARARILSTLS